MNLKGNPKVTLIALVVIFFVALALSIHSMNYTGGGTVLQYTQSPTGQHVIYVHFISNGSSVSNTNYVTHPCLFND
ncbi:MAG: hypothetical protein JRN20_03940 [Nitrososphaerota archaeon]|nr:hypothetical protein [Nitrososphaerota archaeon]MDG6922056.1 hypothetical protein [Nitrososphaerota archaeon]